MSRIPVLIFVQSLPLGLELRLVILRRNRSVVLTSFIVGVNNHRQFVIFILSLVTGVIAFDWLVYQCAQSSSSATCPI